MTLTTHCARLTTALAFACLGLACVSPAIAGSEANPEVTDGHDDVLVNGTCDGGFTGTPPCPSMDFLWPNVDIADAGGWVYDTDDSLVLVMKMQNSAAFAAGPGPMDPAGFEYDWVFTFAVANATYTASAHMDDKGAITAGGVASAAVAASPLLTWTVPRSAIGNATKGTLVTGLFVTAHGEDGNAGLTLDDRAPNANEGRPYTLHNGTAPVTKPSPNGTAANGTRVPTPSNPGPASPTASPGIPSTAAPTTAATGSPAASGNGTASTPSAKSPGASLAAAGSAVALALVALRRRR